MDLRFAWLCDHFAMLQTVVRAACPHDGPNTCAVLVTGEDGRAVRLRGHPAHPPRGAVLCTTASHSIERTYHDQRVLHALRRLGPYRYRGTLEGPQGDAVAGRFFHRRGASHLDRTICSCKAAVGERARPGVVNGPGVGWKKLAADGRNANELTHQGLTDVGRAPTFYDHLVEVEPAAHEAA